MKTLSLKLDDDIFAEADKLAVALNFARNRYINEALKQFNKINRRELIRERLKYEYSILGNQSMEVLAEYDDTLLDGLEDL